MGGYDITDFQGAPFCFVHLTTLKTLNVGRDFISLANFIHLLNSDGI